MAKLSRINQLRPACRLAILTMVLAGTGASITVSPAVPYLGAQRV
jgi:hypothetical protein